MKVTVKGTVTVKVTVKGTVTVTTKKLPYMTVKLEVAIEGNYSLWNNWSGSFLGKHNYIDKKEH